MPLSTRRSFTRGTPRGLFGRNGLMAMVRGSGLNHAPDDAIKSLRPVEADSNTLILFPLSGHSRHGGT
jgi:hypothetical protein